MARGSTTAWIQRGTTTGATARGDAPGSGAGGSPGRGSSGGFSAPPAPTSSRSCCIPKVCAGRSRCTSVCRLTGILFVGDVGGAAGRRVVRAMLGDLRTELEDDFVVINGENVSGGIGITPKHADELFSAGADVITLGNHSYRHREVWPYLEEQRAIIRPANFLPTQPGRGTTVVERDGVRLGVVNLAGNLYMNHAAPALLTADDALREVSRADLVLVDMH